MKTKHEDSTLVARRVTVKGKAMVMMDEATYQALFGLLATCGMRVGEAVGLDREGQAAPMRREGIGQNGLFQS